MKVFRLDGKSHAVSPDDILVLEGPGTFMGTHSGRIIELYQGQTITMTFDRLVPGEAVTMACKPLKVTTFYRPHQIAVSEQNENSRSNHDGNAT